MYFYNRNNIPLLGDFQVCQTVLYRYGVGLPDILISFRLIVFDYNTLNMCMSPCPFLIYSCFFDIKLPSIVCI